MMCGSTMHNIYVGNTKFSDQFPPSVLCCGSGFPPFPSCSFGLRLKTVRSLFYVTFKAQLIHVEAGLYSCCRVVDENEKRHHAMPLLRFDLRG